MTRRILRDMGDASGDEIRNNLRGYLDYERMAYVQMLEDILPSSDYVVDGTGSRETVVENIINIIKI